jgi:hypothetical protein
MEEYAVFCYKVVLSQIDGFYAAEFTKAAFFGVIL